MEKNAKLTKEKLIRARGSWFVDHILGTYALKRQNLDWSGVKDQHVTSYLNPLLEMGHIFDSDKEFGPDLVKRRDLSNLVKLMDAKSISTEWNIKNFDIKVDGVVTKALITPDWDVAKFPLQYINSS